MRARLTTRLLILVPLAVIILLNVHLINEIKEAPDKSKDSKLAAAAEVGGPESLKPEQHDKRQLNATELHLRTVEIPDFEAELKDLTRTQIRDLILQANQQQSIRNEHFISELLAQEQLIDGGESSSSNGTNEAKKPFYPTPKFLVIVIQVHSRLNYLEALIDSLRNTKYIEQALVVFSHDLYIPSMNDLIQRIDFCAVSLWTLLAPFLHPSHRTLTIQTLQIFYPLSLQIYPDEFPGQDPNDCPKSIKKAE